VGGKTDGGAFSGAGGSVPSGVGGAANEHHGLYEGGCAVAGGGSGQARLGWLLLGLLAVAVIRRRGR
jgi:MYXO-CTERM domain-containing protein